MTAASLDTSERRALDLDAADPLSSLRERFLLPPGPDGRPAVYFCGNSLGLQPRGVATILTEELDDWARLAVEGHFEGRRPWYRYHEIVREPLARLVGAEPGEVVAMNGLTVNLHLMMTSFFRPRGARRKVLMEACAFPSDTYAVRSQLRLHGLDPERDLLVVGDPGDERPLATEAFEEALRREGDRVALVLLGGVNYFTGQLFDLPRIAAAAREHGCAVGLDLAHAVGNVPLRLHAWEIDFAVWCSYKYLNAGPGAVAGCFVHARHAADTDRPRLAGWWGNDPERRFRMHLEREFEPAPGADGWQLSNPPVLGLAPLIASLALFDEAGGMGRLRERSMRLTAELQAWIDHVGDPRQEVLTPRDPAARGCQISLRVRERGRELFDALARAGVVCDVRPPDVVRLAPVPLYCTFHDVWRAGHALAAWSEDREGSA